MNELTITPASDWRQGWEGALVRLPSGRVARIRDVSLDLVVRLGRIPDALTPLVIDLFEHGQDIELPEIETIEDLRARLDFRDAVVRCAFVEPRIVDQPAAADELPLEAIVPADRWFVFRLLGRPVHDLERFRREQESAVDAVDVATGHPDGGQPDPEPARVGEVDL